MKLTKIFSMLFLSVFCLLITMPLFPAQNTSKYDILFINGRVMDGTGNPSFYADVAVRDGKIAAIGRLKDKVQANRVIDIKGKIIAPGFIDIHSHAFDSVADESVWKSEEKRFSAPN